MDRREYILARLRKDPYERKDDSVLTNVNIILDALEDIDMDDYPITCSGGEVVILPRTSLLEVVLNFELVIKGVRLCYLLDEPIPELTAALYARLTGLFDELTMTASAGRHLVFRIDRWTEFMAPFNQNLGPEETMATLLGYSYVGDDFSTAPNCTIDFMVGDIAALYSFMCPRDKYRLAIRNDSEEKARFFTKTLSHLGFAVTTRIRMDDV